MNSVILQINLWTVYNTVNLKDCINRTFETWGIIGLACRRLVGHMPKIMTHETKALFINLTINHSHIKELMTQNNKYHISGLFSNWESFTFLVISINSLMFVHTNHFTIMLYVQNVNILFCKNPFCAFLAKVFMKETGYSVRSCCFSQN